MRLLPVCVLAALCTAAPAAHAQMTPAFTHNGVFLRFDLGGGYLHSQASTDGVTYKGYGGAPFAGVALGGAIAENLVIFGEVWAMAAPSPTFATGSVSNNVNNADITLNYGGVGLGLGYFFMPANVFFGISLDATRLGITNWENSDDNTHSNIGGGATVTFGKQWWLSDHTGLGISIKGIGGGNRDTNNSTTIKTFTGLGMVSLTFG